METVEIQPMPPERQDGHRLVIVSGINVEIITDMRCQLTYLRNISGRLLQSDDIRMLLQVWQRHRGCHVDTRSGRVRST